MVIRGSIAITISIRRIGSIMIIIGMGTRLKCMSMGPTRGISFKKETGRREMSMPISLNTIAMRKKKAAGSGTDNRGMRSGKGQGTVLNMIARGEKAVHRIVSPVAGSKQNVLSLSHIIANIVRMIDIGSMTARTKDRWKSKRKAIVQEKQKRRR